VENHPTEPGEGGSCSTILHQGGSSIRLKKTGLEGFQKHACSRKKKAFRQTLDQRGRKVFSTAPAKEPRTTNKLGPDLITACPACGEGKSFSGK